MYQEELLHPWYDALADDFPGLEVLDGHLHVGTTDPAGYQAQADEVLASLRLINARGVVPMLAGEDGSEGLELARAACQSPDGPHGAVLASVDALLEAAEQGDARDPLRPLRTPGFDLVLTAALVCRTPDVALPGRM